MTAAVDAAEPDPQVRLWLGLRAFFHALTTRRQGWTVLYRQAATGAFAGEVDTLRPGRVWESPIGVSVALSDRPETP